jgi:hypothetical protein
MQRGLVSKNTVLVSGDTDILQRFRVLNKIGNRTRLRGSLSNSSPEKVLAVVDQPGYYRLSGSRVGIDDGLRGRYEIAKAEATHRS